LIIKHLVHMVWADGTYDMVAVQERAKYGRTSGIDFGPIDYVKYAEAFGAKGARPGHRRRSRRLPG
jgi:acetolactate synthase I/II/III large subunit